MPPPPHTKPENVLKRAQELIGVGQSQAALNLLHEHVTSKRTRNNPIASIEPVMLLFVELSVDLRKGKSAKDGLYSYKNTAQNTNVGTIELVLKRFIELAEQKVTEAQAKADEVQSSLESGTSTTNVEDLEATETPESILLSTVSGEQSRDRTDRAIVTPWLKFLWETYRTVLDILKNNARLETMYQSTAHQAFQFCLRYTRKTEFRRLCELLRNHLQNAAKYQSQIHAINLSDPDTLQRHLDTRFQQLHVAVELELWQEAFRSVEDIHTLLSLSKRPAKNVMMANYFEKLSRIFLVSENYLFHAAAYNRYYNLLRGSAIAVASGQGLKKDNPAVTETDLSNHASFVILSALSIPVISTSRSRGALADVDEARKNKNQRLTNLLGLSTAPTRSSLFKDIISKGLLNRARSEIRDLYNILEVDFHPLSICKKIAPILAKIGADPEMGKYVAPLQQVILTRLFQQLSQVYESVDLQFVLDLAEFPEPFQVSKATIEKFIMNGCKKGDLAIRIDHASKVLTFDSDVFSSVKALHPSFGAGSAENDVGSVQRLQSTPAEIVRSQLTRLAKTLFVTCQYVDPSFTEEQRKTREAALSRTKAGAEKEHLDTLARQAIIERKKKAASSALAQKEKEEATQKRQRAQKQQEEEVQRLAREQHERDQKRIKAEQERIEREEVERQLEELKKGVKGVDVSEYDISELDSHRIRAIKIEILEKEKSELSERLRVTGKRIDHLERAFRREEIKHLPEDHEEQVKRDREEYETTTEQTLKESKEKHQEDVALKRRLSRLIPVYEEFRDKVRSERRAEFEKRRKNAARELEQKKQARTKEHRDRKIREQQEREAREQAEREEEERIQREAEEKAAAEEERRRKMAEEKARREEENRKLDEIAAKQREREEAAEARRRAGPLGSNVPLASAPAPASDSARPPRLPGLGEAKGGWRERLAQKENEAKQAAQAAPTAAAAAASASTGAGVEPETLRSSGGYIPPHLRNRTDGAAPARGEAPPAPPEAGERRMRDNPRGREDGGKYQVRRPGAGPGGDRTASPANGLGMKDGQRSFSGRRDDLPPRAAPRDESPAAPAAAGTPATAAPAGGASSTDGPRKYTPGAFRRGGGVSGSGRGGAGTS